jgi:glutaredoxin
MKKFRQRYIPTIIFLLLFSALAYGDTWTPTKNLSNNAGDSRYPAIAAYGSNIYVVWEDYTPSPSEIYFKKSDDGGASWTTTKNLSNSSGYSYSPAIAVNGQNIYVVWHDTTPENAEIYFKKSDDGGTTWTGNKRLTNNAGSSWYPAVAVDGSNIYVVWSDYTPGNAEIYFKKSDDGGTTWTGNKRLTNNTGDSWHPAIAVNGSNIYVVWHDFTPADYEIYFKKSDDRGATWTTTKNLSNSSDFSNSPAIAVNGQNIYVVWDDITPGNDEIYFKKSTDEGVTWTSKKRLTNNKEYSFFPAIAVGGENIYVVWTDNRPLNPEIYFKNSGDGGATWTTKRLTWTPADPPFPDSLYPAIAAYGSNIYVVWDDSGPINWEIYFKKGILD